MEVAREQVKLSLTDEDLREVTTEHASQPSTVSAADLLLSEQQKAKIGRSRHVLQFTMTVIGVIGVSSILMVILSTDPSVKQFAQFCISTILGLAVGSIWQSSQRE